MLDRHSFIKIIEATPLVSVDLIILRNEKEVLLGLRNNRPAQGLWFVPGGRILKNESIRYALVRIADKELGMSELLFSGELKPIFYGAYEHMYDDCFAGNIGISTHYVVLAHKIEASANFKLPKADEQHAELRWWSIEEALASNMVHQYTKNYFLGLRS